MPNKFIATMAIALVAGSLGACVYIDDTASQHAAPASAAVPVARVQTADLAPRILNARITAPDRPGVEAAAAFYKKAFGMQEVRRLDMPTYLEIFLNFGATVEQATANTGSRIAIITSTVPVTESSHIVMQVADIKAAYAAIPAAGGTIQSGPTEAQTLPITIGMIRDPAGNRIELVEYKRD